MYNTLGCINGSKSLLNLPAPCTAARSWSITTLMAASLLEDVLECPKYFIPKWNSDFSLYFSIQRYSVDFTWFFLVLVQIKSYFLARVKLFLKRYTLSVSLLSWSMAPSGAYSQISLFYFVLNKSVGWIPLAQLWHTSKATYILQMNNLRDQTLKMEKPWIFLHAFCFWLVVFS